MKYTVGIDIGGSNTRVALLNEKLEIIERQQFKTNINDPYETLHKIDSYIQSYPKEIVGIGLSCPGPLDLIHGKILNTPNLRGEWHYFEIKKELELICGYPVYLENDANLAALAEAMVGEGKNYNYVQFLTISTGVGSGLVINKEIYQGAHGYAHEIANMCMWKDGPTHGSIYPGGIEAIASGTAITTRAQAAKLDVEHAGQVAYLANNHLYPAMEIMDDAIEYLANAIATIYAIVDPEIVILGGSVALKINGYVEEVEKRVKQKVYPNLVDLIKIRKSTLNEDSGLIGAGCLALNKSKIL